MFPYVSGIHLTVGTIKFMITHDDHFGLYVMILALCDWSEKTLRLRKLFLFV